MKSKIDKKTRTTNLKIKKEMLIVEIIEKYPQIAEILVDEYGLHCIGCMGARMETLEDGLMAHGMTAKQMVTTIKKLNELI